MKQIDRFPITLSLDEDGIEFNADNGKYIYESLLTSSASWYGDTDFDGDEKVGDTEKSFKSLEKALRWLVKGKKKSK